MGKRATVEVLTPQARLERAKRTIAQGIDELVEAKFALTNAANDWVDQFASPLGHRRHLDYVRDGKLTAKKIGRRVLVKRQDLNELIEREGLSRGKPENDEDVNDVVDELLSASPRGRR